MMDKDTWNDMMKHGYLHHEINWLAVDNKGQLGIFTALLEAPLPDKVKSSFENYQDLRQSIELTPKSTSATLVTRQKGNFSDWLAYANKGFFAFDFQDVHRTNKKNQYDLIARPAIPLTVDELHLTSVLMDSLVQIDCDFEDGDVKIDKVR